MRIERSSITSISGFPGPSRAGRDNPFDLTTVARPPIIYPDWPAAWGGDFPDLPDWIPANWISCGAVLPPRASTFRLTASPVDRRKHRFYATTAPGGCSTPPGSTPTWPPLTR